MFTIINYSPTGNAAYVAKMLGQELETEDILALEHTLAEKMEPCDHMVFIYAIHAFNAPLVVRNFIKALPRRLAGKVSLIGVGCNTTWINQASSKSIRKLLEFKGYSIVVDTVMAMPLTLVMKFSDDMTKDLINDVGERVAQISRQIKEGQVSQVKYPLNSQIIQTVGKAEPIAARMFGLELHASDQCINCGLCEAQCPTKNIKINDEGKVKFGFHCSMCLRCIYQCPSKAISPRISKFIPIKGGYSLEDYLKS